MKKKMTRIFDIPVKKVIAVYKGYDFYRPGDELFEGILLEAEDALNANKTRVKVYNETCGQFSIHIILDGYDDIPYAIYFDIFK